MLWGDTTFTEGDEMPAGQFMQPRVEVEIGFVMARDPTYPRGQKAGDGSAAPG